MLVVDVRRHEIYELKRVLYFLLYDLKDQPTRSAKQYLVVHKRDSDILYELIYLQLVIRNYECDSLRLSLLGVYLADNKLSYDLLKQVQTVFSILKSEYLNRHPAPVQLSSIASQAKLSEEQMQFIAPLVDDLGVFGRSKSFSDPNAYFVPREESLLIHDLSALLNQEAKLFFSTNAFPVPAFAQMNNNQENIEPGRKKLRI